MSDFYSIIYWLINAIFCWLSTKFSVFLKCQSDVFGVCLILGERFELQLDRSFESFASAKALFLERTQTLCLTQVRWVQLGMTFVCTICLGSRRLLIELTNEAVSVVTTFENKRVATLTGSFLGTSVKSVLINSLHKGEKSDFQLQIARSYIKTQVKSI